MVKKSLCLKNKGLVPMLNGHNLSYSVPENLKEHQTQPRGRGKDEYTGEREPRHVHSQRSSRRLRGPGHSPRTATACPDRQGRGCHSGGTASLGPPCSAPCQMSWLWWWKHGGQPQTENTQVTDITQGCGDNQHLVMKQTPRTGSGQSSSKHCTNSFLLVLKWQ